MNNDKPIVEWSEDEIIEACRQSKVFFFKQFYQIDNMVTGALETFDMRDYQREIMNVLAAPPIMKGSKKLIIGLKARQIGWTTLAVSNALHDVLFNELRPWMFISRNEKAAQKMLGKAVLAYHRLPYWMRRALPTLKSETQSVLEFDNLSYIESVPATPGTGRGDAVHGTLMDECAFMEYGEEIWGAVKPLTYGTAMLFSTANGMGNFFHDIWLDSQSEGTAWEGLFFPWHVVPERDEEWYEAEKRGFRGREWLFFQEYPSSPEEAFAKSGRVAFASDVVAECFEEIEPHEVYAFNPGVEPRLLAEREWDTNDCEVKIWRPPVIRTDERGRLLAKPNYVVGVDVAEGLEHGDFSYISVFDTFNNEQVASCRSHVPVHYLADLLEWVGYKYFKALMVVERNMAGLHPIHQLASDRWYPRMYRMNTFASMPTGGDRTPRYGWNTDRKSKPKMVLDFQEALVNGNVVLHDRDFVVEAQTFIADGKGSYGATHGNHDDTIMGTLVGWQGVLDSPSYPIVWQDEETRPITHDELDKIIFREPVRDNPLDRRLGSKPQADPVRRSFIVVDGDL